MKSNPNMGAKDTGKTPKSFPMTHTTPVAGKSHDADVMLGEGLAMGKKKHGAHDKVRAVKHDTAAQGRAFANHERIVNGGADPEGDCGM